MSVEQHLRGVHRIAEDTGVPLFYYIKPCESIVVFLLPEEHEVVEVAAPIHEVVSMSHEEVLEEIYEGVANIREELRDNEFGEMDEPQF